MITFYISISKFKENSFIQQGYGEKLLKHHFHQNSAHSLLAQWRCSSPSHMLRIIHQSKSGVPCIVWIADEWADSDMLLLDGVSNQTTSAASVSNQTTPVHHQFTPASQLTITSAFAVSRYAPRVLLTVFKQQGEIQRHLYLWINRFCIGCEPVRTLQRAWRRRRERRRLAVCMADSDLLARIVATLCVEDLRKMV